MESTCLGQSKQGWDEWLGTAFNNFSWQDLALPPALQVTSCVVSSVVCSICPIHHCTTSADRGEATFAEYVETATIESNLPRLPGPSGGLTLTQRICDDAAAAAADDDDDDDDDADDDADDDDDDDARPLFQQFDLVLEPCRL